MNRFFLVIVLGWVALTAYSQPPKKWAFIAGNAAYVSKADILTNPVNDVDSMSKALRGLGFTVISGKNLTKEQFDKFLDDMPAQVGENDVCVAFYAGHGLQYEGENYLVPIDANIKQSEDIPRECVPLTKLLNRINRATVKIALIDACRVNHFPKSNGRGMVPIEGLANPNNPAGTLLVFATEEGKIAEDSHKDKPGNGLFTGILLRHIRTPNLSINDMIMTVRTDVYQRSGGKQLPTSFDKMTGSPFYFKRDSKAPVPSPPANAVSKVIARVPQAFKMIKVEGGTFVMGAPGQDNQTPHEVELSTYYMTESPITVGQYLAYCRATKRQFSYSESMLNTPVVGITHEEALQYAAWQSKIDGVKYTLPTEAQWEFAAQGGLESKGGAYVTGLDKDKSYVRHDVKEGIPNELGIKDLSSNVPEWCLDGYDKDFYRKSPKKIHTPRQDTITISWS